MACRSGGTKVVLPIAKRNMGGEHNVRPELLLTTLSSPHLFSIDPYEPAPPPMLVHAFSSSAALRKIADIRPDRFAVIASYCSLTSGSIRYSSKLWAVDFAVLY